MKQALTSWLRDWAPVEQDALVLRSYEPVLIPGLLQTEEYARACLARGQVPADEVEEQVAVRMERQAILTRKAPVRLTAVMDEFVLRRPIGGPEVMKDELEQLIDMAAKPHIHLHVVPAEVGAYAGLDGGYVIATLPEGQDVGYVDNPLGGQLVELSADVLSLRNIWEDVRAVALPEGLTIALIEEVRKSWS